MGGNKPTKNTSDEKVNNDFATTCWAVVEVRVTLTINPATNPIAMIMPASGSMALTVGRSCKNLLATIVTTINMEYNKKRIDIIVLSSSDDDDDDDDDSSSSLLLTIPSLKFVALVLFMSTMVKIFVMALVSWDLVVVCGILGACCCEKHTPFRCTKDLVR